MLKLARSEYVLWSVEKEEKETYLSYWASVNGEEDLGGWLLVDRWLSIYDKWQYVSKGNDLDMWWLNRLY